MAGGHGIKDLMKEFREREREDYGREMRVSEESENLGEERC